VTDRPPQVASGGAPNCSGIEACFAAILHGRERCETLIEIVEAARSNAPPAPKANYPSGLAENCSITLDSLS
jgi:hypothetical protein